MCFKNPEIPGFFFNLSVLFSEIVFLVLPYRIHVYLRAVQVSDHYPAHKTVRFGIQPMNHRDIGICVRLFQKDTIQIHSVRILIQLWFGAPSSFPDIFLQVAISFYRVHHSSARGLLPMNICRHHRVLMMFAVDHLCAILTLYHMRNQSLSVVSLYLEILLFSFQQDLNQHLVLLSQSIQLFLLKPV